MYLNYNLYSDRIKNTKSKIKDPEKISDYHLANFIVNIVFCTYRSNKK